jgi:hypothetical protein
MVAQDARISFAIVVPLRPFSPPFRMIEDLTPKGLILGTSLKVIYML